MGSRLHAGFICEDCGCEDIQVPMWVKINDLEVIDIMGYPHDKRCWCPECDAITQWKHKTE